MFKQDRVSVDVSTFLFVDALFTMHYHLLNLRKTKEFLQFRIQNFVYQKQAEILPNSCSSSPVQQKRKQKHRNIQRILTRSDPTNQKLEGTEIIITNPILTNQNRFGTYVSETKEKPKEWLQFYFYASEKKGWVSLSSDLKRKENLRISLSFPFDGSEVKRKSKELLQFRILCHTVQLQSFYPRRRVHWALPMICSERNFPSCARGDYDRRPCFVMSWLHIIWWSWIKIRNLGLHIVVITLVQNVTCPRHHTCHVSQYPSAHIWWSTLQVKYLSDLMCFFLL